MILQKISVIFFSFFLVSCVTKRNENSAAAEINTKLSMAYLTQLHDVARAKQKLLLAQQQAPHDPAIWYVTGYFLETTHSLVAAEKAYLHAINLDPQRGASHNNYGTFLCRSGRYHEAVQQFQLAVNDPEYLSVSAAYKNAALCASKIPDLVLADKFFHLSEAN